MKNLKTEDLPKKQDIFGRIVKVEVIEHLEDDTGSDGLYIKHRRIIQVDKSLKGLELLDTYLGECLHALFDRTNIRQGVEDSTEEIIVHNTVQWLLENCNVELKK